jgi:purine-binding chemotaxis protein CheW
LTTPFIVLRIATTRLALPMDSVVEVARMVAMAAHLPRGPRHCLGVIDYHGQLVPVLDLGARLGLSPTRREADFVDGHLLLVKDSLGMVGYAVDEVCELGEQAPAEVSAAGVAVSTVRCGDDAVAPLMSTGSFLTVLTRQKLREGLAALRSAT